MTKFDVFLIKFILKWLPPETVEGIKYDEASNNYAFVNFWIDGQRIEIRKIRDGKIVGKTGSGANVTDVEMPIAEITNPAYKVVLHKKGWNLHYASLLEAASDLAGLFYLRRFRQAIYNRRVTEYDDQIGVLKAAQAMKKERLTADDESMHEILTANVPISRDAMLKRLYGNQITLSPMYYPYYKLLEHSILAWIDSGEMAHASQNNPASTSFIVTPKALNTLAEHQLNMQKHRDSVRPAKIATIVAIVAVILTAAQVYLSFADQDDDPAVIVIPEHPSSSNF